MQNLKTRFRKLCWGEAWLRDSNVSANRMQSDESWLSKAMLRCSLTSRMQCQCKPNAELENSFSKVMLRWSLTSRMQRYNLNTPKSNFFRHLISHPYIFKQLSEAPNPFIYKHFRTFFKREKKWNRDIPFYRIPISKTYVIWAFLHSISTESLPWPVPWGFVKNRCLFPLLLIIG